MGTGFSFLILDLILIPALILILIHALILIRALILILLNIFQINSFRLACLELNRMDFASIPVSPLYTCKVSLSFH